jgi:TonB family protein
MSHLSALTRRIGVASMIVLAIASVAAAQAPPVRVSSGIQEPKKLKHVEPVYPDVAGAAGAETTVVLDLVIGPDGSVTDAKLLRGRVILEARIGPDGKVTDATVNSTPSIFEQAALQAVRQWRYAPTLLNGQPVEVLLTVTVKFGSKFDLAPTERIRVGGIVSDPKLLKRVEPIYPREAAAAGVSGTVILDVGVGKDGSVIDAKVLRSPPEFEAAALDAIRQWRYTPSFLNGEAIEVQLIVTINFRVRSPRD